MSSRVLRDGLIDSEVIADLHDKTFRLWIHVLLAADDYGLVEIEYGAIKRAVPLLDWNREIVAKMLEELVDARLILPYEAVGKRYAAVARWQTRIQSLQPRYPQPPFGMGHVLPNCSFKTNDVRLSAEKIINVNKASTSNRDTPETLQRTAGGSLDTKGEGRRDKDITPPTPPRLPRPKTSKAGGEKDFEYPKIPPYIHDGWIDREFRAGRLKLRHGETYEQVKSRLIKEREGAKAPAKAERA